MPTISAVICHYNPTLNPYLRFLVCLCVAAINKIPDSDLEILVCDGSPEPDPFVAQNVTAYENVRYLHGNRQLSFGETYNLGVHTSEAEFVVLIANDVLISSLQIKRLVKGLSEQVACTIPYLTRADYATQIGRRVRVPGRSFPSSMTINVNAFRRTLLLEIGGVPETLSGGYNDAVIFYRLRQKGYRIVLHNVGEIDHLRAITRRIASNLAFEKDRKIAPTLEKGLFAGTQPGKINDWARIYANSAQCFMPRLLWRLISLFPCRIAEHRGIGYLVAWLEPYLSAKLSKS